MALEGLADGEYPRNSLGETYGNHLSARYLGYEPDLIAAVSEDGTEGYIESGLRLLGPFSSEEEAIACDNWRKEKKIGRIMVPFYNSEHQEIGTFLHGIGNGGLYNGVITLEEFRETKELYLHRKVMEHSMENIHYCKAEAYGGCTMGTSAM